MLFINYGSTHSFSSSCFDYINICFFPEVISGTLINERNAFSLLSLTAINEICNESDGARITFLGRERQQIEELLTAMLEESREKQSAWDRVLENYFHILMTKMLRKTERGMESNELGNVWREISDYIDSNLNTELTRRVVAQAPHMLFENDALVALTDGDEVIPEDLDAVFFNKYYHMEKKRFARLKPNTVQFEGTIVNATVTLDREADIEPMGEIGVHFDIRNNCAPYDSGYYNLELRWWLPEGFSVSGAKKMYTIEYPNGHSDGHVCFDAVILAGETVEPINRCVLEITAIGRPSSLYLPITLIG